jgi:aspartate aminotransferase
LCEYLIEDAKVAVVPGSAFYAPGYVRLSYATSQANIEKGLSRIGEALARLK